jgi:hypothetical protein
MSGLYENLPFERGATYGATDADNGEHLEGKEYVHEDKRHGTGLFVKVRIVRNTSAAALLPKRLVQFPALAGKYEERAAGYTAVTAQRGYVVDEFLPAAGVPVNDLFYVVVEGPTLIKTSLAGNGENVIALNDPLHALTGATSGATTSGRVITGVFTGATAALAGQIRNVVGHALSAATTANTNSDLLINAGRF